MVVIIMFCPIMIMKMMISDKNNHKNVIGLKSLRS